MAEYKLNFPIETPEAKAFWESRHRLNRIKAIMAFSLDKDNANDNLRRAGYYRQYRKRYLDLYECIIHYPEMTLVPFSDLTEFWYDPIAICPLIPPGPVTAFTIGDLSSLVAGQVVDQPKLTLTPTNSIYEDVTLSCSPTTVADMLGTKVQLKTAGTFTLTVTVNNKTGATPANVTQTKTYTVAAAPSAPVFTTQPHGTIDSSKVPAAVGKAFFQEGSKLQIVGAAASDVTSWQWQKLGTDGVTWSPVPVLSPATTPDLVIDNASDSEEGTYRIVAFNGTLSTASDTIVAQKVFLYLQNDDAAASQAGADASMWGLTPWGSVGPYSMPRAQVATHVSPISAFIRDPNTPTVNLAGGSAIGVVATSDSPTVVVITDPNKLDDRSAHIRCDSVGTAKVTFTIGDLSDELTVIVNDVPVPAVLATPAGVTAGAANKNASVGQTTTWTIDGAPAGSKVTWTSADPKIAEITPNGVITPKGKVGDKVVMTARYDFTDHSSNYYGIVTDEFTIV